MTEQHTTETTRTAEESSAKWAPWWLYLVVLVPANWIRSTLVPDSPFGLPVPVIAAAQAAVLFVIITGVWRVVRK